MSIPTPRVPELITRRPTGRPSWPFLGITGPEKCGKSYSLIELSREPWIDRFLVVEFGEATVDEYGAIPGADFEIVPTDGTYSDLLAKLEAAVAQPSVEGKVNAIVLDSASVLWELLVDEQQVIARRRAAYRANGNKATAKDRAIASGEIEPEISMDQWNAAKARWTRVINLLRQHARTGGGPAFITARLHEVTVVENGKPTTNKDWKPSWEKNTAFALTGQVQFREYRKARLVGMHSLALGVDPEDERRLPNFTIAGLLEQMNVTPETVAPNGYTVPDAERGAAQIVAEHAAQDAQLAAERPTPRLVNQAAPAAAPAAEAVAQARQEKQAESVQVAARLRAAVESEEGVASLRELGNTYRGSVPLSRLTIDWDGEATNAGTVLRGLIAAAAGREQRGVTGQVQVVSGPRAGRDSQWETPAPVEQVSVSASAPAAEVTAPIVEPLAEPIAQEVAARDPRALAEDERQAAYATKGAHSNDAVHTMLVGEIEHVLADLIADLPARVSVMLAEKKKANLGEVSPLALLAWVKKQRPDAVKALREQSRATEAAAYVSAGKDVMRWDLLLGSADTDREEALAGA